MLQITESVDNDTIPDTTTETRAAVWHVRTQDPKIHEAWLRFQFRESGAKPVFPRDYEHIATVDSDDIDEVYSLTNSIDRAWYNNPGITVVKATRSTSMGDVVLINGEVLRCERIGWSRLELDANGNEIVR